MGYSILYSNNSHTDEISLLTFVNDTLEALGEGETTIDVEVLLAVLKGMKNDFPHPDGLEAASAFKMVANFTCFFIATKPIPGPFSVENVGEEVVAIDNHQNAIMALQLAIQSLHGAAIARNGEEPQLLENRIELSKHSYIDTISALHDVTPASHFRLVSVFLEQLCYKSNPECQYPIRPL